MRIAVTGASGSYGRQVTDLLLARVLPSELILISRNPAGLAPVAARGAQVRFGDFDKPETLEPALAGADKMLLISTLAVGKRRQQQHRAAIEAAGRAGVKHVVYTSSVGIHPKTPSFACADHYYTEELLRRSGMAFTFLRDAQYAEIIATMIVPMAIQMGKLVMSTGDGPMAFVSKKDCVASAAAVLTSPGHEGAIYEITGPELYTFRYAAALAAELSGKPVEYAAVTPEEKQAFFDAAGVPRAYKDGLINDDGTGVWGSEEMISYERAVRERYFSVCSHHVHLLTGRPAHTLREVFLANLDALKV
jgi:NAD(P)H dehydrogenase (quinone)